jgi:hypothetical protein
MLKAMSVSLLVPGRFGLGGKQRLLLQELHINTFGQKNRKAGKLMNVGMRQTAARTHL